MYDVYAHSHQPTIVTVERAASILLASPRLLLHAPNVALGLDALASLGLLQPAQAAVAETTEWEVTGRQALGRKCQVKDYGHPDRHSQPDRVGHLYPIGSEYH
jgi:hypothetical protein